MIFHGGCKCPLKIPVGSPFYHNDFQAAVFNDTLCLFFRKLNSVRRNQQGDLCSSGNQLAEQFQTLCQQFSGRNGHSSDIPARPSETRYKTNANWVVTGGKDNGY